MSAFDPKRTSETVLRFIDLNLLPTACFTLVVSGVRGATSRISPGPCPRCGGQLEFKANVAAPGTGSGTYFFVCKDCDHNTVDKNRLETNAAR